MGRKQSNYRCVRKKRYPSKLKEANAARKKKKLTDIQLNREPFSAADTIQSNSTPSSTTVMSSSVSNNQHPSKHEEALTISSHSSLKINSTNPTGKSSVPPIEKNIPRLRPRKKTKEIPISNETEATTFSNDTSISKQKYSIAHETTVFEEEKNDAEISLTIETDVEHTTGKSLVTAASYSEWLFPARLTREEAMEHRLAEMQIHLQFLDSLYRARQVEVLNMQHKIVSNLGNNTPEQSDKLMGQPTTLSPEVVGMLKNLTGTRTASGLDRKNLQYQQHPFIYQLMPHLLDDPLSLRPAFHMKGNRQLAEIVIGIPTVRRDKESYLLVTLTHLITGMTEADMNDTLIMVMVGEPDLAFVINTARQIENMFPKEVENGLIEVLAPSPSYYPDFDSIKPTLGDSVKRMKWRTKQNLDTIYLMAYAQSRGTFYLMLEDDVIAKKNYMRDIKYFTASVTVNTPHWMFIEYCVIGGIGKLFRSSDLVHFITYVQLFYSNMPIDWLLESYLADKVCPIYKTSKECGKSKTEIRPKYKSSLFQHIGLYSSLKGKVQKVQDSRFGKQPTFYPHDNPPLESIRTDIEERADHTLARAYEGKTFFWGLKPKKGDYVEFTFQKPTLIERYTFRSGNVDHLSDKFYDTAVEILPLYGNYTRVGSFDEFGLADGSLGDVGPLAAIRLAVLRDSTFWVILSEIELKTYDAEVR